MKIQLKRSNQLDGGSAKAPSIGYMEYGELAVNFNEADPCIFIKASDGAGNDSIVRIAGAGAESGGMPDGPTADRPSTPSTGDLYFDTDLNLIVYWDGSNWIEVSPGVQISESAPNANKYPAGTLWYNNDEEEGALYILYEDPAGPGANVGGKIWVQIAGSGGGSGGSVVVADTPPNAANEGDLWFDSESGRLYIWYVNINSQGQWIDASPEGPNTPQEGDLKYDIANEDLQYWDGNAWVSIGGIGSSVTTEEPTNPSNGDLWWNTADNTLYIWYEDGDTGQWVVSVPQGSGGGGDGEYVSKTDTASQNIVSDLTLGTDKITLDATAGSATFASGAFSVRGSDGATIITQPTGYGALFTSRDGTITSMLSSDGQLRLGGTDPTDSATSNIFLNGVDGSATFSGTGNDNTVVIKDGGTENVQIKASGAASFNGRINNLNGFHTQNVPSTSGAFSLNDINGNPISYILGDGSATFAGGAAVAGGSEIRIGGGSAGFATQDNGGTGIYAGSALNLRDTSNNLNVDIKSDGKATFATEVVAGVRDVNGVLMTSTGTVQGVVGGVSQYSLVGATGNIEAKSFTKNGVPMLAADYAVLWTEADNDAYYTTTTDAEGNETRVYNGPTLDVKDRLQNLIARMDALEADEISDDAASSALLTLIASLTARIDARDAVITDLTTRIQTLEGGNN